MKSEIKPKKRNDRNKYTLTYRIPGYSKPFYESFDTLEEANIRAAEINYLKAKGELRPPVQTAKVEMFTLSEFLDKYVEEYGTTHWGDSQYSSVVRHINDYIKPSGISRLLLKDIRTQDIDKFYNDLLSTTAIQRTGHKQTKTVGISVIEKIHSELRAALNQAVRWGYISSNPASCVTLPEVEHKKRDVWTPEEAQKVISSCDNRLLKVAILLAIACSMRIGEILGLTWDHFKYDDHSLQTNSSRIEVVQELKRCEKAALEATKVQGKIYLVFPELKVANPCKTVLVLKKPKTDSSIRTLYVPNSVARELIALKAEQNELKAKLKDAYNDFNLVFAQPTGRPTEERIIAKELSDLIEKVGVRKVVFHSLRHLSTSVKLKVSGGDVKAVQGDTGHAQSSMVTDVYSTTFDSDRLRVAGLMEETFFNSKAADEQDLKNAQIISLLKENPELSDLLLALAKKKAI